MKLLYDLTATQPSSGSKVHGGGNYGIILFFALLKRGAEMECVVDTQKFLRPDIEQTLKEHNIPVHDINRSSVTEILNAKHFDVYYTALTIADIVVPNGTRYIGTQHGLRELEMPRDRMMLRYKMSLKARIKLHITWALGKRWKRVLLKRVQRRLANPAYEFVTVSEHTKHSILSYLPEISADKLHVFYSPSTSTPTTVEVKPYTTGRYIFLVSGNRPEKNALRAVMAMDEIITEHSELSDVRMIIAGAIPNSYRYKLRNPKNFEFPGYVDEATLASMYCGAELFVYPSLNEGFGYPPIEAMRFGVPVIASPHTSIAEVCDDAALYFNPFDYKELKGRILRMLTDSELRKTYSQRSVRRFAEVTHRQEADLNKMVDFIIGPTQ